MIARLVALLHLGFAFGIALLLSGAIFFLGFLVAANVASATHPTQGQPSGDSPAAPTATPVATPTGGAPGGARPTTAAVTMSAQDASQNAAFAFAPNALTVHAGETVVWKNASTAPHTVVGFGTDSGLIVAGGTFAHTFTQAGTFPYVCTLHPGISGTITVVP